MDSSLDTCKTYNDKPADYTYLLEPIFESCLGSVGDIVLQQGQAADYFYHVIAGSVEISYKPYDGNLITLTHVKKGGWFGWSAAVGSKYYSASAIVIEPLEAVRVLGSDLRKFCMENPEIGEDLLERLANSVSGRGQHIHEQVMSILAQVKRGF